MGAQWYVYVSCLARYLSAAVMKTWLCLFAASLLFAGCATSTIDGRRQERIDAYNALPAEQKFAVDAGQIKVGMPMDAVYIAWGKPSQVLTGESPEGTAVVWLYLASYLDEYRYWGYYDYCYGGRYYAPPYLAFDYYPRTYVRAEVRFVDAVVREWRSLSRRAY
jgi:hypothetical protein